MFSIENLLTFFFQTLGLEYMSGSILPLTIHQPRSYGIIRFNHPFLVVQRVFHVTIVAEVPTYHCRVSWSTYPYLPIPDEKFHQILIDAHQPYIETRMYIYIYTYI